MHIYRHVGETGVYITHIDSYSYSTGTYDATGADTLESAHTCLRTDMYRVYVAHSNSYRYSNSYGTGLTMLRGPIPL